MKLPSVWKEGFRRHAENQLRMLGAEYARIHQLPEKIGEWHPEMLREKIMRAMRISVDHTLPLDCHETGVIRMEGYTIQMDRFPRSSICMVTGRRGVLPDACRSGGIFLPGAAMSASPLMRSGPESAPPCTGSLNITG